MKACNPRTEVILKLWNDEYFQSRNVEHVRINNHKILALALELADKDLTVPDWKIANILPTDNRAFASYLPYLCAVNFSFTNFHPPFQRFRVSDETGSYTGSHAMSRCFYRKFGENPIDPSIIVNISGSEWESHDFFAGVTDIPLLGQRRHYLMEVAQVLRTHFQKDPLAIFEMAGGKIFGDESRAGILDTIELYFPKSFGDDCMYYEDLGINVPLRFAKRAQLWMMLYQGRALASNGELPLLEESEVLGPIADSAIPNALRNYGILEYDEGLSGKIDHQIELGHHSPEVREIRMATVVAVQRILEAVNTRRFALKKNGTSFLALDNALWRTGRNLPKPAHLSKTTDY